MAVTVAHHVATAMVVMAHAVPTMVVMAHAMAAVAVAVVHANIDDAGRGIDGADHTGSGGGRCGDADGTERGQGGDGEQGLPHGSFLVGCCWIVLAPGRTGERPIGSDEERLRFEEGSADAQSPDGHG
ncbi:hypothetical protein SAMN05192565_11282 [Methylobacterium gossipiicola]|jgi:hypothetical protein|uniref:Uncharacterized protein n=1 Tax=Methylobacterium gossipiicola TaxID=582675 RepID=A0A1I2UYH3_9HYPH|nr:hypothetical protein SAMN05192565_11282 [Methylobacterium gossipiicola]